jgi:hypothetical protein
MLINNSKKILHAKWVPVTTACLVLGLRMEEMAYRYGDKSCGQPIRGGPPSWGLGWWLETPHCINRNVAICSIRQTLVNTETNLA